MRIPRTLLWLALALAFGCSSALRGQQGNTLTIAFSGAPTGTCSYLMFAKNTANGNLYDCDSTGHWHLLGGGGGTPGGSNTQIQFNDSNAFAGAPTATYDKTAKTTTFSATSTNTSTVFTGTGLNDFTLSGTYLCGDTRNYVIQIDSVGAHDTWQFSRDGGSTFYDTGEPVDSNGLGVPIILECGVSITFAAATGHTLNDEWTWTSSGTQPIKVNDPAAATVFPVYDTDSQGRERISFADFGGTALRILLKDQSGSYEGSGARSLFFDGSVGFGSDPLVAPFGGDYDFVMGNSQLVQGLFVVNRLGIASDADPTHVNTLLGPAYVQLGGLGLNTGSITLVGNSSGATVLTVPNAASNGALTIIPASVSATTTTANTSTTNDQNLGSIALAAGWLNSVGRTMRIWFAGTYSTPALSVATVNVKLKLCTVSGCGSGTVITLASLTSSANPGSVTNNNLNLSAYVTTQTGGASAAFETHGNMTIDLGASPGLADSVFSDSNSATVGTIDSTGALYLQVTGAFSAASGSNSLTQRQLICEFIG